MIPEKMDWSVQLNENIRVRLHETIKRVGVQWLHKLLRSTDGYCGKEQQ